ncbi:MAG: HAD-IA family hydrolase [Chloroflexota bacterium]
MIKAVFFDWFSTIVEYRPPRHELQLKACRESGIELPPQAVRRAIADADAYFYEENAKSSVSNRSPEEKQRFYAGYEMTLLRSAGVEAPAETALRIMARVREFPAKMVLFDDVIPALEALRERGLALGLISNMHRDLQAMCRELGIASYLEFVVTSKEVGAEKPHPAIFRAALERAGIEAAEAMHVGDQYQADARGACAVGINGVLLDRLGFHPDVTDCLRIRSLSEVAGLL